MYSTTVLSTVGKLLCSERPAGGGVLEPLGARESFTSSNCSFSAPPACTGRGILEEGTKAGSTAASVPYTSEMVPTLRQGGGTSIPQAHPRRSYLGEFLRLPLLPPRPQEACAGSGGEASCTSRSLCSSVSEGSNPVFR